MERDSFVPPPSMKAALSMALKKSVKTELKKVQRDHFTKKLAMNIFKIQQLIKNIKTDIREEPDKLPPLLNSSIDVSDKKIDQKWGASIRSRVA